MAFGEIISAVSGIKAAIDITKGINSLNLDVKIKEKTSALYESLISVQTGMLALQTSYQEVQIENEQLKQKLAENESWKLIESQYDLFKTSVGTVIRIPNKNHPTPDVVHWLCANCFEEKKKSILQKIDWGDKSPMICPRCNTKIHLGWKEQNLIRGDGTKSE